MVSENQNISISTNPGVGKTLIAATAIFNRIDMQKNYTQAVYVVDNYESVICTTLYLSKVLAYTGVKIGVAIQFETSFTVHFDNHVIIGTPKALAAFRMLNVFDMKKLAIIIFDDADRVLPSIYVKDHLMNAIPKQCQTLFMASSKISTLGISDMKHMELFVDDKPFLPNIQHFFINCVDDDAKFKMLQSLNTISGKLLVFFYVSKPGL